MKNLKEIIDYLFKLSLRHISLMMRLARYISFQTKVSNGYLARKKIRQRIFSKKPLKVLYGPFKGMTYPDSISIGSVWLPKMLGTYESELHDILEEICSKNYSTIINIGAGEGYYAVGLALRIPTSMIYAFEADLRGQDICRQMVKANNVSERVSISGYCDREQLAKFAFDPLEKVLIICDCEGCELELLCPDKLTNLRSSDMLVELHDYSSCGPTVSQIIYSRFKTFHSVEIINRRQRKPIEHLNLEGFDLVEQEALFSEDRKFSVGWAYLRAKAFQFQGLSLGQ